MDDERMEEKPKVRRCLARRVEQQLDGFTNTCDAKRRAGFAQLKLSKEVVGLKSVVSDWWWKPYRSIRDRPTALMLRIVMFSLRVGERRRETVPPANDVTLTGQR